MELTFNSDDEMVTYVGGLTKRIIEGKLASKEEVRQALEPLGSHVGPFGATSFELEQAMAALTAEARMRGIDI
uniref:Uncharacterized protein n=1 Tax=uncultured bacterium pA1 TaxID=1776268 RepID=A0A0U3TQU0_9BACT|nr:hypothetical protein [uncultured bacterium pA1]